MTIRISCIEGIYFVNGKEVRDTLEYPFKVRLMLEDFKKKVEKEEIRIKSTTYDG